jgi:hypothetical protein
LSFLAEIKAAIEQIVANPYVSESVGNEIRRKLVKRFPYCNMEMVEDPLRG